MFAPLTVQTNAEKSGLPTMAAISGVTMLVTNEVTTAPNAAPITTATARSITLPRKMNCLNPVSIGSSNPPRAATVAYRAILGKHRAAARGTCVRERDRQRETNLLARGCRHDFRLLRGFGSTFLRQLARPACHLLLSLQSHR